MGDPFRQQSLPMVWLVPELIADYALSWINGVGLGELVAGSLPGVLCEALYTSYSNHEALRLSVKPFQVPTARPCG